MKTTHSGKDIKLKAIHDNRTVQIETNYNFLDHRFEHSSRVSLDPNVWTSYELHITNKTTVSDRLWNGRNSTVSRSSRLSSTGKLGRRACVAEYFVPEEELQRQWILQERQETVRGRGYAGLGRSRKPEVNWDFSRLAKSVEEA